MKIRQLFHEKIFQLKDFFLTPVHKQENWATLVQTDI